MLWNIVKAFLDLWKVCYGMATEDPLKLMFYGSVMFGAVSTSKLFMKFLMWIAWKIKEYFTDLIFNGEKRKQDRKKKKKDNVQKLWDQSHYFPSEKKKAVRVIETGEKMYIHLVIPQTKQVEIARSPDSSLQQHMYIVGWDEIQPIE